MKFKTARDFFTDLFNKESLKDFTPQLYISLKTYDKEKFIADLMSGLIVGIVALPLAIAFGIASGVTPQQGIITAIIAGFIISMLGGSRVQIGGPTGAFIVIVYGVVQTYGVTGLIIATMLAGIILILLGVFKLGKVIKFIPYPIIVGFTSGIAVTIFTTQIPDILGLDFGGGKVPGDFVEKWHLYFRHIGTVNWWNTLASAVSILIIVFTPKVIRKVPGTLIAIIVITVAVYFIKKYTGVSIDTIGDRFTIQAELPSAEMPRINMSVIGQLLPVAVTIALLGAIESLLSATVADGMIGGRKHNSNMELIAQGAANFITPLFGGIPATGAIARTIANINSGGRTPVAGMVHAVVLLLILLLLMPLAEYIPMACLAGILVVVAYNMSEWRTFRSMVKNQQRADVAVLLTTFFLTVLFDLTIAIEIGMLLAVVLFIKRINDVSKVTVTTDKLDLRDESEFASEDEVLILPKEVEVYEIDGPFFFGIANKFDESMRMMGDRSRVRIIRLRKVPFMDSTGLHNLESLCENSIKGGIEVILSGVNAKVKEVIERSPIPRMIGEENICDNINQALKRAEYIIETIPAKKMK